MNLSKTPLTAAKQIKKVRKDAELTQTEFANVLGHCLRSVQAWEAGHKPMHVSTWRLIHALIKLGELK